MMGAAITKYGSGYGLKRLSDYFQSFSLFNYLIFPHIFPTAVYLYTGQPHQNNVSLGNKRSFQPPPLPIVHFPKKTIGPNRNYYPIKIDFLPHIIQISLAGNIF